jgi:hypothetical protein
LNRRVGVYDQVTKAYQDIVAPEVHSLRGDIRLLDQRVVGLDQKIDGIDVRVTTKIDSLRTELIAEIRRLDAVVPAATRSSAPTGASYIVLSSSSLAGGRAYRLASIVNNLQPAVAAAASRGADLGTRPGGEPRPGATASTWPISPTTG